MKTFATCRRSPCPSDVRRSGVSWRALPKKLGAPALQAKLKIGAPNDRFEREADRVANQVMRMPTMQEGAVDGAASPYPVEHIQRLCSECEEELHRQPIEEEEELLQTKATPGLIPELSDGNEASLRGLKGGGQSLPKSARRFFEPRFGADFSSVRVHHDPHAAQLAHSIGARAFTLGNHVVFGSGEFTPESTGGRHLIAHELTHVVQQGRAPASTDTPARSSARAPAVQRLPFGITLPTGMRFLDATERGIASPVYGSSLNYNRVLLSNAVGGGGRPYTVYMSIPVLGGVTVINIGPSAYNTPGSNPSLLLHELAHSWQSQHHPSGAQFMINSIASQAGAAAAGGDAYCYVPGKWFGLYAAEQIAEQVEDGVAAVRSHVKSVSAGATDVANVTSLTVPRWETRGAPGVHC